MLGLSSIALRSSSGSQLMQQARQNARLALTLAIGELQSATGPDKRITASAESLTKTPAQGPIIGVWEGWKWDGSGQVPDFDTEKSDRFLRWLVSSPEDGTVESEDFATSAPTGKRVEMVDGGPNAADSVSAHIVPVSNGGKGGPQAIAWAVFDESTKIPAALPEPDGKTLDLVYDRLVAAPLPGYSATTVRNWKPLEELKDERRKLITATQPGLSDLTPEDYQFHDMTSRSAGIAVDVADGGLATDMSRLFDDAAGLPADYTGRHLYSGEDTPLVPSPARYAGANPFPSPDPSWKLLRSHYRMYDKMSGGTSPYLTTSTMARPPAGTSGADATQDPFFHNQQILPVISKAQFVFSLGFGWHNNLQWATDATLPEAEKDEYITWLVVDPVITLWNPYNVTIRYSGGRIDLYRVPLAFRFYKNGTLINSEYTHLANTFLGGASTDMGTRSGTYYRLNLLPETGKSEITLAPGEHIVLTAQNHVKHANHQYQKIGLDLRPGFSPPAGNASAATVGGTSTLNVCVSSIGTSSGFDYGKAVRTIAVKPLDLIQVEVKPLRAEVDKPKETGGKEISGFFKYYAGPPDDPVLVGGMEFDYAAEESTYLESYSKDQLPGVVVSDKIPKNTKADDYQGTKPPPVVRFKEPFLISTFQLKTEQDSKFPSRGWIQNSPINSYASAGLDQTEPWAAQQYELQWEAMTDWPPSSPTIEISNTNNRGYGGPGIYAQTGLEFATHSSLPLAPALSIPQLRHAPLNTGGQLPLVSQVVANSFAPPQMDASKVRQTAGQREFLDHSYLANSALFDSHFFSGVADSSGPLASGSADAKSKLRDFLKGESPLPNPRFIPYQGGRTTDEIVELITASDGYRKTAAHLLIDSPFNINSTRVDVWEALLASTFGQDVPIVANGKVSSSAGKDVPVLRHLPSPGSDLESGMDPVSREMAKWNGYRRLTSAQIRKLAEEIVIQVRERGPFLSIAEFVNRQPGDSDHELAGTVQAALEKAGINDTSLNPAFALPNNGNTADGAPGVITQADLLTPIAPVLTARGDTFRIRAYGEAGAKSGPVVRVWCEAVVQRVPDYLDPAEEAWEDPLLPVNQTFRAQIRNHQFPLALTDGNLNPLPSMFLRVIISALLFTATGNAQQGDAKISTSVYAFARVPGFESVNLPTGGANFQEIRLSEANIVGPVSCATTNGKITIHSGPISGADGKVTHPVIATGVIKDGIKKAPSRAIPRSRGQH